MSVWSELIAAVDREALSRNLPAISPETLIARCRAGEKEAWDLLFRRHLGDILRGIKEALPKSRHCEKDLIFELYETLVIKLLQNPLPLGGLRDPGAIGGWLRDVARNHATDHLRQQKRKKGVLREIEEARTVAFDNPKAEKALLKSVHRLPDPGSAEADAEEDRKRLTAEVLKAIEQMDEEDMLIAKTLALYYEELGAGEIALIAKRRGLTVEAVRGELARLETGLFRKYEKTILAENKAGIQAALLDKAIFRWRRLALDPSPDPDKKAGLRKEIERLERSLKENQTKAKALVRPSNRQIAELLGIPAERVKTMNVRIHRIRKELKKIRSQGVEDSRAAG